MPVDFDVVVEVDPDLLPCGQSVVGLGRSLSSGRSQSSKISRLDFPYSLTTRSFCSPSFSVMAELRSLRRPPAP